MRKQIIFMFSFFFIVFSTWAYGANITHKVKPGDSLYTIAKKHKVKVSQLKGTNGLKTSRLRVGQELIIKRDKIANKSKKGEGVTTDLNDNILASDGAGAIKYRVQRGDNLQVLAERFKVDEAEIIEANNLQAKRLRPGMVLLIPKGDDIDKDYADEIITLTNTQLKPWKDVEERYMLVKVAKSFIGAPYKYGGESIRGLDCSAFVKKIYGIFDVNLPRSAREQFRAGMKVSKEELAVGDLVFFRTRSYASYPTHVGIYIGEDSFIHSSSSRDRIGVRIDSLSSAFYNRTYLGAVRVKAASDDSAAVINIQEVTNLTKEDNP